MPRTDLLILRQHRDGSVHAATPTVAFQADGDVGVRTHADQGSKSFRTLCGSSWWNKCSAWGFEDPCRVTCPECRTLLMEEAP